MAEGNPIDVDALEDLRHRNPAKALALSAEACNRVHTRELPGTLGVYGSCLRVLEEHDRAFSALQLALEIAEHYKDRQQIADLFRRLSYVFADWGNYHRALNFAKEAHISYCLEDFSEGLGRALVAEGLWHFYLGAYEESLACQLAALRHLPQSEPRHRAAAFHSLAYSHLKLGNTSEGAEYAREGKKLARPLNRLDAAKMEWLEAIFAEKNDEQGEAEKLLEHVIETLCDLSPVDAALASIDWFRMMSGKVSQEKRRSVVETLVALIGPVRQRNRVASAAVEDLVLRLRRGEAVNRRFLAGIRGRLEASGRRARRHAPAGLFTRLAQ